MVTGASSCPRSTCSGYRSGIESKPYPVADAEETYRSRNTNPVIAIDRSDVYWAIAYLDFAEAALDIALAYDWDSNLQATLIDPARVKAAYPRVLNGIRNSMRLRASLLEERHDRHEWISNPRHVDTVFPSLMDAQTFASWDSLLRELDDLVRGKTLLGKYGGNGLSVNEPLAFALSVCPAGEGLDVRSLFMDPVRRLFETKQLAVRCMKPTRAHPLTGLAPLISAS